MGVGDEIVAAGQAQRIFEATGKRVVIVGADAQVRWNEMWTDNPAIAGPLESRDNVVYLKSGPNCRPYIVYPFDAQRGWTFNTAFRCRDHIAKLYLTSQEYARGQAALEAHGSYVLIEPYTKHGNFRWPIARWHDLVAAMPEVTFVQHTHRDSVPVFGAHQEPATFREACGLVAACDVYVRSESGLCHAAAALGARQVTLFGGCMDPEVMGYYPKQWVIRDDCPPSPCGRWRPCAHCAECMDHISVEEVVLGIRHHLRQRRAA